MAGDSAGRDCSLEIEVSAVEKRPAGIIPYRRVVIYNKQYSTVIQTDTKELEKRRIDVYNT